jgi:hypothetical protein
MRRLAVLAGAVNETAACPYCDDNGHVIVAGPPFPTLLKCTHRPRDLRTLQEKTGRRIVPTYKTSGCWQLYLVPQKIRLYYQVPAIGALAFFLSYGETEAAWLSFGFLALVTPALAFGAFPARTLEGKWRCPDHLHLWFRGIPLMFWDPIDPALGSQGPHPHLSAGHFIFHGLRALTCAQDWKKTSLYWRSQEFGPRSRIRSWAYAFLVSGIADHFGDGVEEAWFSSGFKRWLLRFCSPIWGGYIVLLGGCFGTCIPKISLAVLSIGWLFSTAVFLLFATNALRWWIFLPPDMRPNELSNLVPWVMHDQKVVRATYDRAVRFGTSAFFAILFISYLAILQLRPF